MGDEHKYWNTDLGVVSKQWGVVVISTDAAAYVSSQPCKECWIKTKAGNSVYINIDNTATATNGFPLCGISSQVMSEIGPLPMSNLSSLNLFPVAICTVFILWRA
jgi:hypothetical protein